MAKTLRILVVDDDVDNAQSLGELFEMEGHEVTVAHSGEAAIAAYVNTPFDIAFMDVMMPGKNGVESFLEIRKLRPEARVYMMTGYSVEQLLQQAMEHGALGVLSKPLDGHKLLRAIEDVTPHGIVVVSEDDLRFGGELTQLVRDAGFSCDLVRNTAEADNARADVMVIDTGMQLIRGVEIYARMKRQGRAKPAFIITRNGEAGDAFEALRDVAVTGILNKPFDPLTLLNRLESLAA